MGLKGTLGLSPKACVEFSEILPPLILIFLYFINHIMCILYCKYLKVSF